LAINWEPPSIFCLNPRVQRENVNPITLPVIFRISFALYCIEQCEVYVGEYYGVLDIFHHRTTREEMIRNSHNQLTLEKHLIYSTS